MNPYEVLGVPRDASDNEIKEAYREKVKEFHPDTSEREDTAEMFMKVKEAYETVYSGDSEEFFSYSESDREYRTEDGYEDEQESHREKEKEGFGTTGTWTQSDDFSGRTGRENAETNAQQGRKEGFYDGWDRERRNDWGEAEWKEDRQNEKQEGTKDGEDPEEFEVHEEYDMGWKLGRAGTGEWFVFTESETAPYVEGTKMLYLDTDGSMSTQAVYYATREAAEGNYEKHYGAEDDFGHEHEKEESHRGFSQKGETYRQRTEQRTDGFGEEGWGEKEEFVDFDGLWKLYYQEKSGDGGRRRRWGVTTDVTGDDRFVNPGGEYQRTEFWFDGRHEAMSAYERYVRGMKEAREGFEGVGVGAKEEEWNTAAKEKETLVFKIADRSITFLEAVEDRIEPLRENSLTVAVALFLVFAFVAYVFDPVRETIVLLSTPIYVGFATLFQTPHLIFFVIAYAIIVTVLVMSRMSTRF